MVDFQAAGVITAMTYKNDRYLTLNPIYFATSSVTPDFSSIKTFIHL